MATSRNRGAKHGDFVVWRAAIMIEEPRPHGKTRQVIERYTILAILLFKKRISSTFEEKLFQR